MRTTAIRIAAMGAAVALAAGLGAAAVRPDQRLARFVAGCVILNWSTSIDVNQKKAWYGGLAAASGLTPEQARQMIAWYRDRPAEWAALLQQARESLEKTQ